MKPAHLQPAVRADHAPYAGFAAGEEIRDHDLALAYVLDRFPALLPSYAGLPPDARRAVLFTQGKMHFNHGWFVQAEAPPGAMLSTFKRVLTEGCAQPADVALYFLHWVTDLAGAEATPLGGAEKLVIKFPHNVLDSFLWSIPFLQKLASASETEVVEDYLVARWQRAGAGPLPRGPSAIARLRLAVMAQGGGTDDAFLQLPPADQLVLTDELARTGCAGQTFSQHAVHGGPAVLVYYGPALLQRYRDDPAELLVALGVLCEVYRAARVLWPVTADAQASSVTVQIGQLKAHDLETVTASPADEDRSVWVVRKQNACEASVELCLATEVNELNAAEVQYFVPHFSAAAKTDIHVL